MESVISKLLHLIFEDAPQEKIEGLEEVLEESIEDVVDAPSFYELPLENIIRIIRKSNIQDIKIIKKLVSNFSEYKGEEAPLILNVVDTDDADLDEYIDVVSALRTCPICRRIGDIRERDKTLPMIDYKGTINELEQENAKLKEEIAKLKNRSDSPRVTSKPTGSQNIASKTSGSPRVISKPTSSQKATRRNGEMTPLNNASGLGNIDEVKYYFEKRPSDIETKDSSGMTPLNNASYNNNIDIVKFLVEHCHANVETRDNSGMTPLNNASCNGYIEVVKYLVEHCHANIETTDNFGMTPLKNASERGLIMVKSYLIEKGAK